MKKRKNSSSIFIYRGLNYLEQPKNTRIVKTEYKADEKLNYVYLKKNCIFAEAVCTLIVLASIIFNLTSSYWSSKIIIPDSMNCYDGLLYTNIIADKDNIGNVKCLVNNQEFVLEPGDYIKSIIVDDYSESTIDINVVNRFLIFDNEETYTVNIFYIK